MQALFVTFLWSTSWVIIKVGLRDIPPLTFAGLRYSLAFLCLLPFSLRPSRLTCLQHLSREKWIALGILGLLCYAVTQGTQFVGLYYLPAITVTLLLNLTTLIVALLGVLLLAERPTLIQWAGVGLTIIGALTYFYPVSLPASQVLGVIVVSVGVLSNALSSILGRSVNRRADIDPLVVTTISMGIGAAALLVAGISTQGLPPLGLLDLAIIAWLAVVNTAFAFTLWNHTLRTLSAVESSIINNTMMVQIALLAWLFLGESLSGKQIAGMALVALGALIVQLYRSNSPLRGRTGY